MTKCVAPIDHIAANKSTTTTQSDTTTADSGATMPSGDVTKTSCVGDLNTAAGGHADAIIRLHPGFLSHALRCK